MDTETTTNTRNTPSMREMIGKSTYYAYFAPGGEYNGYFEELLKEARNEKDLIQSFVQFACLGFICGKKEARKGGAQ